MHPSAASLVQIDETVVAEEAALALDAHPGSQATFLLAYQAELAFLELTQSDCVHFFSSKRDCFFANF